MGVVYPCLWYQIKFSQSWFLIFVALISGCDAKSENDQKCAGPLTFVECEEPNYPRHTAFVLSTYMVDLKPLINIDAGNILYQSYEVTVLIDTNNSQNVDQGDLKVSLLSTQSVTKYEYLAEAVIYEYDGSKYKKIDSVLYSRSVGESAFIYHLETNDNSRLNLSSIRSPLNIEIIFTELDGATHRDYFPSENTYFNWSQYGEFGDEKLDTFDSNGVYNSAIDIDKIIVGTSFL